MRRLTLMAETSKGWMCKKLNTGGMKMTKPYKLPSGKWAIRPYKNGKRAFFTDWDKNVVISKANEWKLNIRTHIDGFVSLDTAISDYIEASGSVLSPSTLRGYGIVQKRIQNYDIKSKKVDAIPNAEMQRFINQLSKKYAPKTVRNTYALITATLAFYAIPAPKNINLPAERPKRYNLPSEEDLSNILRLAKGKPMEPAILLAAFGGLRRSEIAGLSTDDIDGNTIHIHNAVVKGNDKQLYEKGTKTWESDRTIELPEFVIDRLKQCDGKIWKSSPGSITRCWERLREKAGISARFHDLRHYSASRMHALNVPDQYIQGRHGWKTDYALKAIYRNELDEETKAMSAKMNNYITETFSKIVNDTVNIPLQPLGNKDV